MRIIASLLTILITTNLICAMPQGSAEKAAGAQSESAPASYPRSPLKLPNPARKIHPLSGWEKSAFEKAKSMGIDPAGPQPSDFIEDTGTYIAFGAGSKFAHWAAAQSGRPSDTAGSAKLAVVLWSGANCDGGGRYYPSVHYATLYSEYDNRMPLFSRLILRKVHSISITRFQRPGALLTLDLRTSG
ncbi:hypothetical protein K440DRAFT_643513 [Wilcoxina mikolae CBS 423.85]|nr:hypothetical protein K440DRAFT_643513 [Wilcoxina mikolae CBS 423.85]